MNIPDITTSRVGIALGFNFEGVAEGVAAESCTLLSTTAEISREEEFTALGAC